MQEQYFVYILKCSDDAYYIGLAKDLLHDFKLHNEGCFEFTNIRTPVEMVYYEVIATMPDALKKTTTITRMVKGKKESVD